MNWQKNITYIVYIGRITNTKCRVRMDKSGNGRRIKKAIVIEGSF